MSVADLIRTMFSQKEEGWGVEFSSYGMLFHSDKAELCRKGEAPGKLQHQYIFLRMLAERGEAKEEKNVFVTENDRACAFTEAERELFGLPESWPGKFELFTSGHTSKTGGFHPELRLIDTDGRKISNWSLEGPCLHIEDRDYLPTAAQYLALSAVDEHAKLLPEKQTEGVNLAVVYALKKAKSVGISMELRHFDNFKLTEAEHIGISAIEEGDGGLRLIPNFGIEGISLEDVEKRLRQLEGDNAVCLRVNDNVVMLDEEKLCAIREILANRKIAPQDRDSFLKAPGAFLDAYFVDLDNGFSLRVHGEEVFRPAYFGETDVRRSSWFDGNENNAVIPLESAGVLICNEEELDGFTADVRRAANEQKSSVPFKDAMVFIPDETEQLEKALKSMADTAHAQWSVKDKETEKNLQRPSPFLWISTMKMNSGRTVKCIFPNSIGVGI